MPSPPRPSKQARILGILGGEDQDLCARTLRLTTNLGVLPYRAVVAVRNTLYNLGVMPSCDLGRPTLSVGNITAGGTGKTPMVIALANQLRAMGHRPAVLLRGYEPASSEPRTGSDEAAVLRSALGDHVPVMPDANRVRAAAAVLRNHPAVSVFLLDDAFQHRKAKRDLNLVLIDATRPFGFGRVLPRGLLREPLRNLRRADAIIITRSNRATPQSLEALDRRLEKITGRPPIAHAMHDWASLRLDEETHPLETLAERSVLGVSGLGNPADFEQRLGEAAGRCVGCLAFDDHRPYSESDLADIFTAAAERGAEAVVTTEKDWVKWKPILDAIKPSLPVFRPVVEIKFLDGGDDLAAMIRQAVGDAPK